MANAIDSNRNKGFDQEMPGAREWWAAGATKERAIIYNFGWMTDLLIDLSGYIHEHYNAIILDMPVWKMELADLTNSCNTLVN